MTEAIYTHHLLNRTFQHNGTVYQLGDCDPHTLRVTIAWKESILKFTKYDLDQVARFIYGSHIVAPCWVLCEPDASGNLMSVAPPSIPGVTYHGNLASGVLMYGGVAGVINGAVADNLYHELRTAPVGSTRTITRKTLHDMVRVAVSHGWTYGAADLTDDDINTIINSVITNNEFNEQ